MGNSRKIQLPQHVADAVSGLPAVAERLLLRAGGSGGTGGRPPLDAGDVQEAASLLHTVAGFLCTHDAACRDGAYTGLLSSSPFRLAFLQILAVASRSANSYSTELDMSIWQLCGHGASALDGFCHCFKAEPSIAAVLKLLGFARSLLCMQSLEICAQQLARAAAEVVATAPSSDDACTDLAAGDGSSAQLPRGPRRAAGMQLLSWFDLGVSVLGFLVNPLTVALQRSAGCPPRPQQAALRSYLAQLVASLRDSCVLEHSARAAVMVWELEAEAEAGAGAAGSRAEPPGARHLEQLQHRLVATVSDCTNLLEGLYGANDQEWLLWAATISDVKVAALWKALSGPCVRHLVLATGVAALCAADGGPSYGMPPVLLQRLPVAGASFSDLETVVGDVRRLGGRAYLAHTAIVNLLFALGDTTDPLTGEPPQQHPPPRGRAALGLLLRLVRLAVKSAVMQTQQQQEEGGVLQQGLQGDPAWEGDAVVGAPLRAPRTPRAPLQLALHGSVVGRVAVDALHAAIVYPFPKARGGPQWWAASTEVWRLAVDVMDTMCPLLDEVGAEALVQWCSSVLQQLGAATVTGALQPDPPAEVATALEGGLLPCLERMVRRFGRNFHAPCGSMEGWLLQGLICDMNEGDLFAQLLLYGNLQQALALIISLGKVGRLAPTQADATPEGAGAPGGSDADDSAHIAAGPWLRRAQGHVLSVVPKALAATAARAAATAAAADPTAQQQLLQRVALVASHAFHVWAKELRLPTSSGMVGPALPELAVSAGGGMRVRELLGVMVPWIQLLAMGAEGDGPHAAAGSSAAASAGSEGSGSTPGGGSSSESSGDGGIAAAAQRNSGRAPGGGGWQREALRTIGAAAMLGCNLRHLEDPKWRLQLGAIDAGAERLELLAECMCRVARALSGEVRQTAAAVVALTAPSRSPVDTTTNRAPAANHGSQRRGRGGRRNDDGAAYRAAAAAASAFVALSYWPPELVRSLAARLRRHGRQAAAEAVEALAAQLEVWGAGRAEGEGPLWAVALPAVAPEVSAAARSLVSPAEVAALLRTCANPGCANLEGDTEAGQARSTCARCGAVWYCGRECQLAHWHLAHKAQCAGARRGG